MQSVYPYAKSISNQPPEQSPPVNKDRFFTSQGRSLFASSTVYILAMIQSRVDCASNFYYHCLPKFLQSRLQVGQNKMIRYVLNYSNRTHLVANDCNEGKWMSIESRIKYLAASHVFNCIDEQAPEYLQVFERVNESHHYNTSQC